MKNNFKIKKCRKNVYISAVYSTAIWCLDLFLIVIDARFEEVSNAEKYLKFCRSETRKTIHDDDAFRYAT